MATVTAAELGKHHVLIIRDPNEEESPPGESEYYQEKRRKICDATEIGMKHAKSFEVIYFHDNSQPSPGRILAAKEDVEKALAYAEDKDALIVSCAAGISRSSAIAYIMARKYEDKEQAMKILDRDKHWPNRHVLHLGGKILNLPLAKEIDDAGFYGDKRK